MHCIFDINVNVLRQQVIDIRYYTSHMIPIYCRLIDVSEISLPAESLISSSHTSTDSPAANNGWWPSPQSSACVV